MERTPPPSVIFVAQLKVRQHDGDFSARDQQNNNHQRQEPKDVIELLQPNGRQDEKELDEHRAEGQDTSC